MSYWARHWTCSHPECPEWREMEAGYQPDGGLWCHAEFHGEDGHPMLPAPFFDPRLAIKRARRRAARETEVGGGDA